MATSVRQWLAASLLLVAAAGAAAQDKAAYDLRNIERYLELFRVLDRDGDGRVTRSESQGDVAFTPRFDDLDSDRDGVVSMAELQRYLAIEHGMRLPDPVPVRGVPGPANPRLPR